MALQSGVSAGSQLGLVDRPSRLTSAKPHLLADHPVLCYGTVGAFVRVPVQFLLGGLHLRVAAPGYGGGERRPQLTQAAHQQHVPRHLVIVVVQTGAEGPAFLLPENTAVVQGGAEDQGRRE